MGETLDVFSSCASILVQTNFIFSISSTQCVLCEFVR